MKKILLIDNYDSFTWNLVHLFAGISGVSVVVKKNDDQSILEDLSEDLFDGVIIGPGPGSPENDEYFGINRKVILEYGTKGLPILGVCLGFQGIWHAFGGALNYSKKPQHGKISPLAIAPRSVIMKDVPEGAEVMRYHSIIAGGSPRCFVEEARTSGGEGMQEDGEVLMAFSHKQYPIFGVQFHPESYENPQVGKIIAKNFVQLL